MTRWVLCPVFRDAPSFLILRDAVLEAMHAHDGLQFVVVDDTGGLDPEIEKLAILDDVRVLTPPYNLGHQGAIVFGLRTLAPELDPEDVVVTMDADGEDRPADVPRLFEALERSETGSIVVARRTTRTEGLRFQFSYSLFKALFRVATGRPIASGNFAALPSSFASGAVFHPIFDFCYSASLLVLAASVVELDAPRGSRFTDTSKMSSNRLIGHGLRMFVPFFDAIAVRALVLLGALTTAGALCLAAAAIWSPEGLLGALLIPLGAVALLGGSVGGAIVFAVFMLWISLTSPAVQRALGHPLR